MPVKIKIDESRIRKKVNNPFDERGLEMLSSQILDNCNKYCKKDQNNLIMSSYIHSDLKHGLLVWNTPYAARQYYEIPTANTDVNPDASWKWVEVARRLHRKDWERQAQAIAKLYGG